MGWFHRGKRTPEDVQWDRFQDELRVAKQHRIAETATTRDLVDAVSEALFRADPIGINFDTNTDEYDAEAETIVIALPSAAGPEEVKTLTHAAFVQWFGAATAGPIERYGSVADDIWHLWSRHKGTSGLAQG
jgi:hypothetical protein